MNNIVLNNPLDGQIICLCPLPLMKYLHVMKATASTDDAVFNNISGQGVDVERFYDPKINLHCPTPVTFNWQSISEEYSGPFKLCISRTPTFESAVSYLTESRSISIYNLKTDTTYYWKVKAEKMEIASEVRSFKTAATPRLIAAGTVRNVRDIGGYRTGNGRRVRQGLIYRGGELVAAPYTCFDEGRQQNHPQSLDSIGLNVLKNELRIKTELDFRRPEESDNITESALGPEVRYIRVPIRPYGDVFGSAKNGQELPMIGDLYRKVFEVMSNATNYPLYFHCWGGADRTGTVAFLLNGLLGVSYTDLIADYELTSFSQNLRTARYFDNEYSSFADFIAKFEKYARPEETISTSIERFLRSIGLTAQTIQNLKDNLIE